MDNYTKTILTIIAFSFVMLNIQLSNTNIITKAFAKSDCGNVRYNACYVKIVK